MENLLLIILYKPSGDRKAWYQNVIRQFEKLYLDHGSPTPRVLCRKAQLLYCLVFWKNHSKNLEFFWSRAITFLHTTETLWKIGNNLNQSNNTFTYKFRVDEGIVTKSQQLSWFHYFWLEHSPKPEDLTSDFWHFFFVNLLTLNNDWGDFFLGLKSLECFLATFIVAVL